VASSPTRYARQDLSAAAIASAAATSSAAYARFRSREGLACCKPVISETKYILPCSAAATTTGPNVVMFTIIILYSDIIMGQQKHNLRYYVGLLGTQGIIWCLINVNQKLCCRYSLGRHIGSGLGSIAGLQRLDGHKVFIQDSCRNLESKAMFIFVTNGWNFSYRLRNWFAPVCEFCF
jgi:hypothetical protein